MTAHEEYLTQAAAAEQDVRDGKLPGRVLELTEAIRALTAQRETLASPPEPQVSEWYRVSWLEARLDRYTAYVNVGELAELAQWDLSGRDRQVSTAEPASILALVEDPASFDLENTLGNLDRDEDTGDAEEFERTSITVTPVTVEEMGLSAPAGPLICWTCSARVSWSGAGYFHTEDGWWPQGKPGHFTPEQFALHTEGRRAEDGYVAVLPDPQRPPWAPPH